MKTKLAFLKIPVLMIFLLFTFFTSSYAAMAVDYVNVNESWNGQSVVNFSIDTSFDNIIGFAIGTNFSFNFGANVDFTASNPAPSDWLGVAAVKLGGTTWQEVVYDPAGIAPPSFTDLPSFVNLNFSAFEGYSSAFVFYGTNPTALDPGFTNGFSGYAFNQDSVFAVFRSDGTIITGDTNVVPIPGAAILLFSGLLGLIGIRKRK